jgi:integrase
VLTISRSVSGEVITTPKSGRARSLTLGTSTMHLWRSVERDWTGSLGRSLGPWVFSPSLDHQRRFTASGLGHRFAALCDAAGVAASLHRLRHNVATFLVGRGEILQAQARLGHADAATTLREYAYALPLTDRDAADAINDHLDSRLLAGPEVLHESSLDKGGGSAT